jgi:hypothetical protein
VELGDTIVDQAERECSVDGLWRWVRVGTVDVVCWGLRCLACDGAGREFQQRLLSIPFLSPWHYVPTARADPTAAQLVNMSTQMCFRAIRCQAPPTQNKTEKEAKKAEAACLAARNRT